MREELILTLKSGFQTILDFFGSFFTFFFEGVASTPFGKVISFIRQIIEFLFYAVRSIFSVIWNFIYIVLPNTFTWITETFENLSLYIGKPAMYLFQLFGVVLIILVFQFILRLFTGKYHYKKVSK